MIKPTPHIELTDLSKIAKTVLMPGDPKRAEYIAKTYLTDVEQINSVRGMLGFTGLYNGKKITVMGSGMGMPSIGIYSYELYKFYGVEKIIRIGSAGAYSKDLKIYDVVLASEAYSESSFAFVQSKETRSILPASKDLNEEIIEKAKKLDIPLHITRIHSSDVFYREGDPIYEKMANELGCGCVEMESFALFNNALVLNKKAACLLTISDSFVTKEVTTSLERQNSFNQMMRIALELA